MPPYADTKPPLDRTRLIVIQVMPDFVHADLSLGMQFLGIDGSTSLVGMFWLPERTPPMFYPLRVSHLSFSIK
jgi:hypothetical protein